MKRKARGKTKKRIREIKCNRPEWRKKVLKIKGRIKYRRRGTKVKSKEWEKVEIKNEK